MAKVMRVISDGLYQELMTSLNPHERKKKDEKKTTLSVENIENLISSRQQKRVKKLLHFFQTSTNIQRSDNNESILQDIPIHYSNIVDSSDIRIWWSYRRERIAGLLDKCD